MRQSLDSRRHMRSFAKALLVALLGILSCRQPASDTRSDAGADSSRVLRLALFQNSYWGGGFDRPLFLAYSDGSVLFPRRRLYNIPQEYGSVQLSRPDLDTALARLGLDASVHALDSLYDFAPGTTDQHSFYLLVAQDSGMKLVVIRAGLAESDTLLSEVPAPFRRLYSGLMSFSPSGAVQWLPDSIRVSIWPYDYAPDNPPLSWPPGWPPLDDARWHRQPNSLVKEVRSIQLPFSFASTLDSLLDARRTKQAFGIDGMKWMLDYRWIFPSESAWLELIKRLES
jgi:hypothetical protein